MEFFKIFIIVQVVFLLSQYVYILKLESYQYYELVFGTFFIVVYFGFFASMLTANVFNPFYSPLNNSALIASFYALWFYLTKKISNSINSDKNGVIHF